jgi:outer membrane lipoprotein-sorting protein
MRNFWTVAVVLCLLGISQISCPGKMGKNLTYQESLVFKEEGEPTVSYQVWVKGRKMRIEFMENKKGLILIKDDVIYIYMANGNRNEAVEIISPEIAEEERSQSPIGLMRSIEAKHLKPVDEVEVEGKRCDVYLLKSFQDIPEQKVWVWKEYNFPIMVEVETWAGPVVIKRKDIKFGFIPESRFKLPRDTEIVKNEFVKGMMKEMLWRSGMDPSRVLAGRVAFSFILKDPNKLFGSEFAR